MVFFIFHLISQFIHFSKLLTILKSTSNYTTTKDAIELHEKERFDIWTITAQGKGPVKGRKRLPFTDVIKRLPLDWNSRVFSEIKALIVQTAEF